MFKITAGRGFQMTFDNGWTVSVQFGTGNYCENRSLEPAGDYLRADRDAGARGCKTAEIAAWNKNETWYDFGNDQVKGYCTPDEVAAFIAKIARF